MPIAQRIRLFLAAALFALAYGTGMKILFELSTVAPFIVTAVLTAGTAIALKWVKREAKLEGAKPNPQYDGPSLLGMIKAIAGTFVVTVALMGAFAISAAAGVSVIMLLLFGFMIAMVLLFVFARIEVRTRTELAAGLHAA